MKTKQLFDQNTGTYTYIIYDEASREAAIIDSVKERFSRDANYIKELNLNLKFALETHVHADHITASGLLRQEFSCQVVVHESTNVQCADRYVANGEVLYLGEQAITVLHTPGHTDGDVTYAIKGSLFTGDALLIRACGRTDFQAGNPSQLYDSITQKLFSFDDDTMVYPGHDYDGFTSSTIGEEKRLNPRLGNNKSKQEFIAIMDNMNLPKPKRIDIALPGNLSCGL